MNKELTFLSCAAHSSRRRGRRSVPAVSRLLPGGLPRDAVHRVQRGQGHLPLLRQQVQLLAHHRGPPPWVCLLASTGDPEGRPGALQSQPLPSLQQDLVVGGGGGGAGGAGGGGGAEVIYQHLTRNKKEVLMIEDEMIFIKKSSKEHWLKMSPYPAFPIVSKSSRTTNRLSFLSFWSLLGMNGLLK